ncbi:SDR family NAD(P)-dependent oxidoreductase [Nocardia salmonicida]|uniref:SDR family NAD(P)-dependent oxidoreductase n=1 Tax=Nocardia salmonicida TaxID=53431 RepID=UPI00366EC2D2
MSNLEGEIALVTGAARGIGRTYALHLARAGAAVGVIDLDLRSFQEHDEEAAVMTADTVVDELVALGVPAAGAEADVTDAQAMEAAVQRVIAQLGDISIAVCNAGGGRFGPPEKLEQQASTMDLEQLRMRLDANFFGTVHTVRAVAPGMKKRRRGKIVTVGSVSGLMARPDGSHADYGAAKAALVHYTKALAAELGPYNINVNCIAPGLIATPRIAEKYGEGSELYKNVALRRLGTPEECASVVEFLASDASSYITGSVLEVHGGTRVPRWGTDPEPWWLGD